MGLPPTTGLSDAELVVTAQAGDMAAFEALYHRYFDPVYDFAVRTTKDQHSAADAVQDAFMKAHERIGQIRNPEAFRPWLYSIVRREALAGFRSRSREAVTPTLEDDSQGLNPLLSQVSDDLSANPAVAAELSDSAALVWEAAASLDADTYAVLDLHVRQGLSSAEIADVLEISKGNAYTKLNRMKERTGSAIATYLLIRKGAKDCTDLSGIVAAAELPPVTERLRRTVDRHVKGCDDCDERRRALVAPMTVLAALAAVPPPQGLESAIWERVAGSSSGGAAPVKRRSWRAFALVAMFVAVLGSASGVAVGLMGEDSSADSGLTAAAPALDTDPTSEQEPMPGATETTGATSPTASTSTLVSIAPANPAPPPAEESPTGSTPPPTTTLPPNTPAPPPDTVAPTPAPPPPDAPTPTATTVPSPPATAAPPVTAAPPPPDTAPPLIQQLSIAPDEIWELDEDFLSCPVGTARVAEITASVSDTESGVRDVEASWTIGAGSTSVTMLSVSGIYTADFGPFSYLTVADNTTQVIDVVITATDLAGNETKTTINVTVNSLAKCFG